MVLSYEEFKKQREAGKSIGQIAADPANRGQKTYPTVEELIQPIKTTAETTPSGAARGAGDREGRPYGPDKGRQTADSTPQSPAATAPLTQGSLAGTGRTAEQIQQEIAESRRQLAQLGNDAAYILTAEPGAELGREMDTVRAKISALNDELNALNTPNTNAERDSLIQRMNDITANEGYATTVEQADAVQQEKQDTRQRLHELDDELGNAARFYDSGERAGAVVKGALGQTGAAYTNFMGTAQGAGNRLHEASSTADQAIAGSDYAGWATDELTAANMAAATMKENPDGNYLEGLQKEEQRLYEKADAMAESAAKDIEQAKEGLSALGKIGVDISTNLIQMGIDAAGRAAGLGMIPFFVRASGGAMQEARQEGASTGQQFAYGLAKGAIEVGTEKLFDGLAGIFGKGAADDVIEGLIGKLTGSNTGRTMLRAFAGAAGEGTEEVISDLLDPFAKLIYNDQALKEAWENRADLRGQMLYDYLIGAAMGGFGSVASIATGQNAEKNARLAGTETQGKTEEATTPQSAVPADSSPYTGEPATPQSAAAERATARVAPTALTRGAMESTPVNTRQEVRAQPTETAQETQRAAAGAETPPTAQNAAQAASEGLNTQAEATVWVTPVEQNITPAVNARGETSPAGQNADAVPAMSGGSTGAGGERVERGFSHNIATDSAMEAELREDYQKNPEMYNRLANKDTLQKAQDIFTQGLDAARAELERAIGAAQSGQKLSPEMVPLSRMVANALTRRGELEAARRITSDIAAELTSAGQLGQAGAILRNADPITVLNTLQKAMDTINKETGRNRKSNKGEDNQAVSGEELQNAVSDAAKGLESNETIKKAVDSAVNGNEEIQEIHEEASRTAAEKLASDMENGITADEAAEAIRNAVKRAAIARTKPEKVVDRQKQIINSAKKFALEKLPPRKGSTQRTAVDVLSDYVQNPELFAEAWEKAQSLLREDAYFAEQTGAMREADNFINEGINVNAKLLAEGTQSIFKKAIAEEAVKAGESKETIRGQYALGLSVDEISGRIADRLIKRTSADGEVAETIRSAAYDYAEEIINGDKRSQSERNEALIKRTVRDIGESFRSMAIKGNTEKTSVMEAVGDIVAYDMAVDPETAEHIAVTAYEEYSRLLQESMSREVERRFGDKNPAKAKALKQQIQEAINIGAFDSLYAEKAAGNLTEKALKELGVTVNQAALGNRQTRTSIRDAVVNLFTENYGLDTAQAAEIADLVTSQFDNMVGQAADRLIEQRFGDKPGRKAEKADVVQKLIEAVNLGTFDTAYAEAAANKLFGTGKIKKGNWQAKLTAEEIQQIANTDFSQEGAFESVQQQIAERLGREMPATLWEKLTEIRRVGMLLRPRTIKKNLLSNVPMVAMRKGAETLSGAIQDALVKSGKMEASEQTRTVKVSKESRLIADEIYGQVKDSLSGASDKWDMNTLLRKNRTYFKKGPLQKFAEGKLNKEMQTSVLEAARRFTYDCLEMGDAPFVKSAFIDSLAQYCETRGINDASNVTTEAIEFATANAMEATFKNANVVAKCLNQIKRNGGPAAAALDILFPFTTTPLNITNLMLKYSPAGFADTVLQTVKGANKSDIIDSASKATVGTAIMCLGYALRNLGIITGGEDEDKDKAAHDKAKGISPYSFWGRVSYDWAQPSGSLLALGAEIADAVSGNESFADAVMNSIYTAGDSVLNMSLFQNVLGVLKGTGKPTQQILDEIIEGGATQLIPGLAGDIAKIIDDTVRSTYTGGNVLDDTWAKLVAVIPGLSKTLPESVNVKGEANKRGNLATRAFNTLINPSTVNINKANDVDKAIDEVYEETGDKTIFRQVSPYKVDYGGETYQMTGEEREQFQKTQGQVHDDIIQQIIDGTLWQEMDSDAKVKTMQLANEYALDAAKRELVESRGDEYSSDWDDESKLTDIDGYLAVKSAASSADINGAKGNPNFDIIDSIVSGPYKNLSEESRDSLDASFSRLDDMYKASLRGIDSETYYKAYKLYKHYQNATGNSTDRAEDLKTAINGLNGLTQTQKNWLSDNLKLTLTMYVDTESMDKLTDAGLTSSNANKLMDDFGSIEPTQGYTGVQAAQKYQTISSASYLSDAEKWKAFFAIATDAAAKDAKTYWTIGYSFDKWLNSSSYGEVKTK